MNRVVITGMGTVSPFGIGKDALLNGLTNGESGIIHLDDLEAIAGLHSHVGGKVPNYDPKVIARKKRRTMSAMSIFAVLAAQEALEQAGLTEEDRIAPKTGLSVSSTIGSVQTMEKFFSTFLEGWSIEAIKSTEFFKIMNHSVAANLAGYFQICGRVIAPSSACSTGCQSIALAAEAIMTGRQEIMLCGGTDELHPLTNGTFDIIEAATTGYNDQPTETPRPFDEARDGIACAEGSGILVLESLDHAKARGATILAELSGFASTADPANMASPSATAIGRCMEVALQDAGIAPSEVDYINAHATGTRLGDAAESQAIASLFGDKPMVSSLKGNLGHTMAASGAIEMICTIAMMNKGVVFPTRNLVNIADDCAGVNHVQKTAHQTVSTAIKNNFALGGINTSIVLRGYND